MNDSCIPIHRIKNAEPHIAMLISAGGIDLLILYPPN